MAVHNGEKFVKLSDFLKPKSLWNVGIYHSRCITFSGFNYAILISDADYIPILLNIYLKLKNGLW